MYLTINRFRIRPGREPDFEKIWLERDSKLPQLDGFIDFHLYRGETTPEHTIYLSHTLWRDEDAFRGWARSQNFRASHKDARPADQDIYLGPPVLEFYSCVQHITAHSPA